MFLECAVRWSVSASSQFRQGLRGGWVREGDSLQDRLPLGSEPFVTEAGLEVGLSFWCVLGSHMDRALIDDEMVVYV